MDNKYNKYNKQKILLKYITESLTIILILRFFISHKLDIIDIFILSILLCLIFIISDLYAPSFAISIRNGFGFIIGIQLIYLSTNLENNEYITKLKNYINI
jgi:membrane-bound ClpP family serine protease